MRNKRAPLAVKIENKARYLFRNLGLAERDHKRTIIHIRISHHTAIMPLPASSLLSIRHNLELAIDILESFPSLTDENFRALHRSCQMADSLRHLIAQTKATLDLDTDGGDLCPVGHEDRALVGILGLVTQAHFLAHPLFINPESSLPSRATAAHAIFSIECYLRGAYAIALDQEPGQ